MFHGKWRARHITTTFIGRGCGARQETQSPGPYRSLRELSLAGLVGSVIWRPPTFVGNPGSMLQRPSRPRTHFAMTKIADADSPKARLRQQALALRDALPASERAAAAATIAARPFPLRLERGMVV